MRRCLEGAKFESLSSLLIASRHSWLAVFMPEPVFCFWPRIPSWPPWPLATQHHKVPCTPWAPCFTSFMAWYHGTGINFHMSQMASFPYYRLSLSRWTSNRLYFSTQGCTLNSHIHTCTRRNDQHHFSHSPHIWCFPTCSSFRIRTKMIDIYKLYTIGIGCQRNLYMPCASAIVLCTFPHLIAFGRVCHASKQ